MVEKMPASTLNDTTRLSVLRALAILDTPAEPAYDDIAMLASASCGSVVAAVNFVDDERHWTKAIVGVVGGQGGGVPANLSLCAATICTDGGLLVVPDLSGDEAWQSHPFVADFPNLRFYAGATITVDQQPIGVVCVFGDEARAISVATNAPSSL
jgi:GAF domain-containing protein